MITDRTRVEQILLNLLGNALKFTDAGHVTASVMRDDAHYVFAVTDTGCGIRPEHMQLIFEDFYQASRPGLAKERGTGLGLPVARRLAQALGGEITAQSEYGTGSTFTLRLPITLSQRADNG